MEYKACSLPYFLDEMQPYELSVILGVLEFSCKQEWEQTRFVSYITAQTQSSKKLKVTDIVKFSWEKDDEKKNTSISKYDIERLTAKANRIIETR